MSGMKRCRHQQWLLWAYFLKADCQRKKMKEADGGMYSDLTTLSRKAMNIICEFPYFYRSRNRGIYVIGSKVVVAQD
jgi:hypothetical protein